MVTAEEMTRRIGTMPNFTAVLEEVFFRRHHWKPNCCLNATRVILDVLRGVDIPSRPLSVLARVYSKERKYLLELETNRNAGGFPGHLVVLIDNRYILDASAGQFHRPQHDVFVPSVFTCTFNPRSKSFQAYKLDEGSGILAYKARPWDTSYLKVSGFQSHGHNQEVAAEVMAELRRLREGSP